MSAPENYTGKVDHTVLMPQEGGKWRRVTGIAEYKNSRLLRMANVGYPDPPAGPGFTGELTVIATITKGLKNGLVQWAKASSTSTTGNRVS
jgi:hypothetical protein